MPLKAPVTLTYPSYVKNRPPETYIFLVSSHARYPERRLICQFQEPVECMHDSRLLRSVRPYRGLRWYHRYDTLYNSCFSYRSESFNARFMVVPKPYRHGYVSHFWISALEMEFKPRSICWRTCPLSIVPCQTLLGVNSNLRPVESKPASGFPIGHAPSMDIISNVPPSLENAKTTIRQNRSR